MLSSNDQPPRRRGRVARGRAFEDRAAEFYRKQGFEIIEQNYQAGHKEIDLIARRENLIVFVEVKSSRSRAFGHPAEWVNDRKRQNLSAAARQFVSEQAITNTDLRFDVVTFVDGELEHYPDAFPAA
jgi:putative endonuclease